MGLLLSAVGVDEGGRLLLLLLSYTGKQYMGAGSGPHNTPVC